MGLKGLWELIAFALGCVGLFAALLLGVGAWVSAAAKPDRVGLILGRGVLGVAAVVAFVIGGFFLAIGLSLWSREATPAAFGVLAVVAPLLLAGEFVIAGLLYARRSKRETGRGTLPMVLAILSYGLAGALAVFAFVVLITVVFL